MKWWIDKIRRKAKLIRTMPAEQKMEAGFYVFAVAAYLFIIIMRGL